MQNLPPGAGAGHGKSPAPADCLSPARALSSDPSMPQTRLAGLAEDAPGGSSRRSRVDRLAAFVVVCAARARGTSPARVRTHQPKER
jgi:hypothetical protein